MSVDYVLAPDGIAGVVHRSAGGYAQMWPSGSLGTSVELTSNWSCGDVQLGRGANQLVLWPLYTAADGVEECLIKVEFAMLASGPWFQEPASINVGAGRLTYMGKERIIPSGYQVTIDVPFVADYVRISAMAVGSPSGSLLGINATIASIM